MRIIVRSYRFLWIVLLVALIPFLLVSSVTLVMLATGEATPDEMALPFTAMSSMSILIVLILGVPVLLFGLFEGMAIRRLINGDYWVKWAQYATEESWHTFAKKQHEGILKANPFPCASLIMLVILFSIIGGVTFYLMTTQSTTTNPLVLFVPVGVFFVFIATMVLGTPLAQRRRAASDYRRRMQSPIPNVYIGKDGLYHEDKGYQTFRGLNDRLINVYYKDGSPSTLNFEIWYRRQHYTGTMTETVRVPSDSKDEADNLAHRFFDEGVLKR